MNGALYLLNALAMVAMVSFHFFAPALNTHAHISGQGWVHPPSAQRAGMHERQRPDAITAHSIAAPTRALDRYTF